MLNTFDNNPKRQSKRAERERRIEEMNASVQIASDELFRTTTAGGSASASARTNASGGDGGGGGADAVDAALDRLGMTSMPLHSTSVFGSSGATSRNSKSSGAGGSDGDDEASSSGDDDGGDEDGSKKSGRSGTDSSFNNPQYSKSFGAGMHAPPLGATDDAVSVVYILLLSFSEDVVVMHGAYSFSRFLPAFAVETIPMGRR